MNFSDNNPDSSELYIKELCIYILRRWRAMISAMLIGAVVLGVYKTIRMILSDAALKDALTAALKFALLGAAAGLFIVGAYEFMRFIFKRAVQNEDELRDRYGLYILGSLYMPSHDKDSMIDKWLDKWELSGKTVEEQHEYELVAAKILLQCHQNDHVMITGTAGNEVIATVYANLEKLMPAEIPLIAAENPVYNVEALTKVKTCKIVLVEKKGVSNENELKRLSELVQVNKLNVIGAVMM